MSTTNETLCIIIEPSPKSTSHTNSTVWITTYPDISTIFYVKLENQYFYSAFNNKIVLTDPT
jgi:hypothetical protein